MAWLMGVNLQVTEQYGDRMSPMKDELRTMLDERYMVRMSEKDFAAINRQLPHIYIQAAFHTYIYRQLPHPHIPYQTAFTASSQQAACIWPQHFA